jgi:hypothetical protein
MDTSTVRAFLAYLSLVAFIVATTIGAGLIYAPAGFIAFGVTCGLSALLLGSES